MTGNTLETALISIRRSCSFSRSASSAASFITGQVLPVDGGMVIG
jgi:NAD(P)-dependent dehydrogenase (short-subunit alcohol dehydrogenase family)